MFVQHNYLIDTSAIQGIWVGINHNLSGDCADSFVEKIHISIALDAIPWKIIILLKICIHLTRMEKNVEHLTYKKKFRNIFVYIFLKQKK